MYQFQLIPLSQYLVYLVVFLWGLTALTFIGMPLSMMVDMTFDVETYKSALKAFLICVGSALFFSAIIGLSALIQYLFTVVPQ